VSEGTRNSELRVDTAVSLVALATHAPAWDRLTLASPERLPQLSYAWVASLLEHRLAPDVTWRCLFAYARTDGELLGVLPVIVRRHPFGIELSAPLDVYTSTSTGHALLAVGRARQALAALLEAASDAEPDPLWVRFHGVRDNSPALQASRQVTAAPRLLEPKRAPEQGSLVRVDGNYEAFVEHLAPNFQRNLRKAGNRVRRAHNPSFRFVAGEAAGAENLLQRFLLVEGSGWKGAAGTGTALICSASATRFMAALTRRLSERGWLEWHFLELDGTPVAAHFAVRIGRSLVLPRIGFDERHGRVAPGNLLFQEMLTRAFADEGIDEINCRSDMPWHRNWQMPQDQYFELRLASRRLTSLVAGAYEQSPPVRASLARLARCARSRVTWSR